MNALGIAEINYWTDDSRGHLSVGCRKLIIKRGKRNGKIIQIALLVPVSFEPSSANSFMDGVFLYETNPSHGLNLLPHGQLAPP